MLLSSLAESKGRLEVDCQSTPESPNPHYYHSIARVPALTELHMSVGMYASHSNKPQTRQLVKANVRMYCHSRSMYNKYCMIGRLWAGGN